VRIALDVMGGDHAPDAILAGGLEALDLLTEDDRLVLTGEEQTIREGLRERGLEQDGRVEIAPASELVQMEESPVAAIRNKPESSMVRLAQLGGGKAGDRRCDIIISAGNTGACVAAAQMTMRRLSGVHRPGIAVAMPTYHGTVVLCDAGANPEPRPLHLHQYAHMAGVFASRVVGTENPRVGLLSIGGEEGKGNTLVRETSQRLRGDQTLNYAGQIEGRDIFEGAADVVVTEGFTGNVVLKLSEGLIGGLFATLRAELKEADPQIAQGVQPILQRIYQKHNYHEFGGAPLLGADGVCIICHGSSAARTIHSAIRQALHYARHDVNGAIVQSLSGMEPVEEEAV
jgi:glycerol-3-phosphate acyltransferase PlsX